jgi:hypothetical protein
MFVMTIILESIPLVIGSALIASLLCWLALICASRMHHQGWAACFVVVLLAILLLSGLTRNEFVRLSAVFGLFGALLLSILNRNRDEPSGMVSRRGE